mmetsp:Transcript_27184/g.32991  ORF Transcript_27184/g.32991 Transcript_27184/m.32991 type:complete len:382 (-) Transcript_27184:361-1506(-)|eukprot:CAMPEP_0197855558 /NCGR_PEP_ID=MMETSP1438-20131217/26861_1 /TAXON_ID=1461541 /ORGANISM="Pterosperma sp., Strain CCMP1384" /LENGTH=381 /DNA_ID=CAMNT_0043470721 /DNA_START=944 /DNA_END=2089 /DNA_ORIENTATION=+
MKDFSKAELLLTKRASCAALVALGSGYIAWRVWTGKGIFPTALGRGKDSHRVESTRLAANMTELIGRTPLVHLSSLSSQTGCLILAKAEHLNPGGSLYDREALAMIIKAEADGCLTPGKKQSVILHPTCREAAIGLALLSQARGYQLTVRGDSQLSPALAGVLNAVGVSVTDREGSDDSKLATTSANDPVSFNSVKQSANFEAHFGGTGPEILRQISQGNIAKIHGYVCQKQDWGALYGCGAYLQQQDSESKVFSVASCAEAEKTVPTGKRSVSFSSSNTQSPEVLQKEVRLDGCFQTTNTEVAEMGRYLLRNEGFFVGWSGATNLCGAVKLARQLPPGSVIVTLLTESGEWSINEFHSQAWLKDRGISLSATGSTLDFIK